MHYLLVELTGGRVLEEYEDYGQALDEVTAILGERGPEIVKTLSITWLADDHSDDGSLQGEALVKAARKHHSVPA
jgi:hypothetical protein